MKKIITLATLGLLVAAAPISAQTVYDAAKITGKDLEMREPPVLSAWVRRHGEL